MRTALRNFPALRGALMLALSAAAGPAAVTTETDAEFSITADFDGDTRLDSLIIDKETGVVRAAYQTAAETVTWAPPRAAWLDKLTGAAAGPILAAGRASLAVTQPDSSRIHLLTFNGSTDVSVPTVLYPSAPGPATLAALDIPGATPASNDPARADLALGSSLGSGAAAHSVSWLRPTGVPILTAPLAAGAPLSRANPVKLKSTLAEQPAFMAAVSATVSELRVFSITTNPPQSVLASAGNLPAGSSFIVERFNTASQLSQALFYKTGETALRVRQVTEPTAGTFQLGTETVYTLPSPILSVTVLPDIAAPRLLVIFSDGASARVYTYNGSTAPVSVATLTPDAGERITHALPLGSGHFMTAAGPKAQRRSDKFTRQHRNANGTYTAAQTGILPLVGFNSGRPNVLIFDAPPFVSYDASVRRGLIAPDWATAFTVSGGQMSATSEVFRSSAQGLGAARAVPLGAVTTGAVNPLVNQYRADVSIISLSPPGTSWDSQLPEVELVPAGGYFEEAVSVQLVKSGTAQTVYLRQRPGDPWTATAGPVTLALDTTVECYAESSGGAQRSPIKRAVFQFPEGGMRADSDNDGVPDFVELARGLSIRSGYDADGDGFTDLEEIIAQTNPVSPSSVPSSHPSLPQRGGFDIVATPVGVSAGVVQPSWSGSGSTVRAWDGTGDLLASGIVAAGAAPPAPSARLYGLSSGGLPYIITGTADTFTFSRTAGPWTGAERVSLTLAPASAPSAGLNYVPLGRTLAEEATAWETAVRTLVAGGAAAAPVATVSLEHLETLIAAMYEHKVRSLLAARSVPGGADADLFPYRSAAAAAAAVDPAQILALRSPGPAGQAAYEPAALLRYVRQQVNTSTDTRMPLLRSIAADIYRSYEVSLPSNTPGADPRELLPLDALRQLLRTGLPTDYAAVSTLNSTQRTSARQVALDILTAAPARPQVIKLYDVTAATFSPAATVVRDASSSANVALIEATSRAWRFNGPLTPPTGTRLRVTGYTDVTVPAGVAPSALEVVKVEIISFPPAPTDDADADGLPDSWELVIWGNTGFGAADDPDGDGANNATELAEGTDPDDECSSPAGTIPNTVLLAQPLSGRRVRLYWNFPDVVAPSVTFRLETSTNLTSWTTLNLVITRPSANLFETSYGPISDGRRLFRLVITRN